MKTASLLKSCHLCNGSLVPIKKKLLPRQVLCQLVYDLIFSNQIFIVSCHSSLRLSHPALWWINIPTSESYSESFTKMVQILKFTIALWGKHSGELQQSGNLNAYESNVGKNAREIVEFPQQPRWSRLVVTSDVQFPSVLQGVARSWGYESPSLQLTSTGFSSAPCGCSTYSCFQTSACICR